MQRANQPRRQGLVEPVWVADRKHRLADQKVARLSDRERDQRRAGPLQPEHGEIVGRSGADQPGAHELSARQLDAERRAAGDDVVVRDDVARLVPHDTGAGLQDIFTIHRHGRVRGAGVHVHHRRRGHAEDVDRRRLRRVERGPRRDGAREARRPPEVDQVRLDHPNRQQGEEPEDRDPQEAVAHPPSVTRREAGRQPRTPPRPARAARDTRRHAACWAARRVRSSATLPAPPAGAAQSRSPL